MNNKKMHQIIREAVRNLLEDNIPAKLNELRIEIEKAGKSNREYYNLLMYIDDLEEEYKDIKYRK